MELAVTCGKEYRERKETAASFVEALFPLSLEIQQSEIKMQRTHTIKT